MRRRHPALDGRVVAITGAGRGIGRATALAAAASGAKVSLLARTEREIRAVAEHVSARGGEALALVADVSSPEDVERAVRETEEVLGPIDLLVNNAGIVARAEVTELDLVTWDEVMDTNLKGVYLASRAVLPGMIERGRGRIVNVSSISGTLGTPGLSAYCASKWGVIGFTKALSEEVKGKGLVVCAVLPGSVDTTMLQKGLPGATPDMTPDDVAETILWLGAEAAPAVTGSAVEVFG